MKQEIEQELNNSKFSWLKNTWVIIVISAIITALIVGGGIYWWQKASTENLQQQIIDLQNQLLQLQQSEGQPIADVEPGQLREDEDVSGVSDIIPGTIIHKILFTHSSDKYYETFGTYGDSIWVVNDDGSNLKEIIDRELGNLGSPTLSPLGNKIAYKSLEDREKSEPHSSKPKIFGIRIYDLNSNKSSLIVSRDVGEASIGNPVFSPDGQLLAYSVEHANKFSIYFTKVKKVTPNRVIQIPKSDARSLYLAWSPNSKEIVYVYDNYLSITDLKGNIKSLINGGDALERSDLAGNKFKIQKIEEPIFSKDEKEVYYLKITESSTDKSPKNLFVINVDGTNNRQLTNFKSDDKKYIYINKSLLEDSTILVSKSLISTQDYIKRRLLLHNFATKEETEIFENDKYYDILISPDGKLIAASTIYYIQDDESGVYLMDLEGNNMKKILSIPGKILEWK